MEFEAVKKFLKAEDFDDDDDYIKLLMRAAEEYIAGAVDDPKPESARYQLIYLFLISNLYENRLYTVESDEKVAFAAHSMMMQLQMEEGEG